MTNLEFGPGGLRGVNATVMGLGLFGGGASVCRFLASRGATVTVTDLREEHVLSRSIETLADVPLRWVLGRHEREDFTSVDLVVANPAVPQNSPYLQAARDAGVWVTSEAALFLQSAPGRMCGITGTQGKSSTCNLLHQLLVQNGRRAHLGGNIGRSLLDSIETIRAEDIVILELSSYQLEALGADDGLSAAAERFEQVTILNILEDHLERHGSREAYAAAKLKLLDFVSPEGMAWLPRELEPFPASVETESRRFGEHGTDASLTVNDEAFWFEGERLANRSDLQLSGRFQRWNALVALGMAHALGVDRDALGPALRKCRGLPYRLEDLGVLGGCRVWDNSVSTTPDSTVAALDSVDPGVTLLLGGQVKDLALNRLAERAMRRARRTICFGAGAEEFAKALREHGAACETVDTVTDAVERAYAAMSPGEELLFSPAAASFDAYPNFEARAIDFREAVRAREESAANRETLA